MPSAADFFFRLRAWINYRLHAVDRHSLHPPFVFEFYEEVIRHPYHFSIVESLESEREQMLSSPKTIAFDDAGAGKLSGNRKISEIAQSSLMPFFKAELLLKLVHWLKPVKILELGTCLGLTTAYLAQGKGKVFTFEASSSLANEARNLWKRHQIDDIHLIEGRIEKTLPDFLGQNPGWDFCIIDANHRLEATMNSFEILKKSRNESACLVLDDIYWSKEMAQAWQQIQKDPEVQVTADLFHLGLVFFRKESSKQHFVLKW